MGETYTFHLLKEQNTLQRAERLTYIDFRLRFMGTINRSDLTALFGIADAAASKEISEYKELRPKNVEYNRAQRANTILRDTFSPLINIDSETALGMLANGFSKNKLVDNPSIPYQRVGLFPKKLKPEIISKITRSIHCRTAINCTYVSGSSRNHSPRKLFPTAIFYDGHSWKFRAFHRHDDPGKSMFKCFNFSRVIDVDELSSENAKEFETLEKDKDWNFTIPLHLKIHPEINNEQLKGIKEDFGLSEDENELIVTEKAALFYFLKKHWAIDCGEVPSRDGYYSFYLNNRADIKGMGLQSMEHVF